MTKRQVKQVAVKTTILMRRFAETFTFIKNNGLITNEKIKEIQAEKVKRRGLYLYGKAWDNFLNHLHEQ